MDIISGLSFLTVATVCLGDLLVWCCAGLGEEWCGQCVAAPFTLLMQSLGLCGTGGAPASPLCSKILSVVSCP